jgi:uroporphyrinogen decarboxylase
MKSRLSHRDRLLTIFAGERPDRYAASFWRHFFHRETSAEGTAGAMVDFQKHFDWDFMKINPRADFHVQDWGLKLGYSRNEYEKHIKLEFPIQKAEDWYRIQPLDLDVPALAEHLKAVALIRKGVGSDLPLLMTIFTPLAIAGRMVADRSMLLEHLKQDPDAVHHALRSITDTFARFTTELRNAGADGLFYATTQWASADMMTWEDYQQLALPYDLEVLRATEDGAINLLHVCASKCFLQQMLASDFDVQMVNWDALDESNLSLSEAEELATDVTLVGGFDFKDGLRRASEEEVAAHLDQLKIDHDSARLIIGPGCAVAPETPIVNLKTIRERL